MRDACTSCQVNLVEETAGFGAELCMNAMGVLGYQLEPVFCHAQQHQFKLCVLELRCLGGKKKSVFCLKIHNVTIWFVRDSKLIAFCEVGWVIYCLHTPAFFFL